MKLINLIIIKETVNSVGKVASFRVQASLWQRERVQATHTTPMSHFLYKHYYSQVVHFLMKSLLLIEFHTLKSENSPALSKI